jgi:hypothetical protein
LHDCATTDAEWLGQKKNAFWPKNDKRADKYILKLFSMQYFAYSNGLKTA